jgi:hypothetical protein
MKTLNFWSKFVSGYLNRPFSQMTHRNGMKLSQIAYIHGFELLDFFQFFLKTFNFRSNFGSVHSNSGCESGVSANLA